MFENNNRFQYSDPMRSNLGKSRSYTDNDDALLLPDYKKSAETWESLWKENIHFKNEVERLENQVDKLQKQNREFRDKLWKYTEKADRLQKELDRQIAHQNDRSFSVDREIAADTINIPRSRARTNNNTVQEEYPTEVRRPKFTNGGEVSMFQKQQAQKIEELTASVAHLTRIISESKDFAPPPPPPNPPSDNDILVRESMELESLEKQVQQVQERLNIKEANEQRKTSLKHTLSELLKQIDPPATTNYIPSAHKQQHSQEDENFSDDPRSRPKMKDRIKKIDPSTIFGTPTSEFR